MFKTICQRYVLLYQHSSFSRIIFNFAYINKSAMKVIVDNKIPFIKEAIEKIADEVVYAPGKDFTPSLVKDADALIIRTRTRCNRELLAGRQLIGVFRGAWDVEVIIAQPVIFHDYVFIYAQCGEHQSRNDACTPFAGRAVDHHRIAVLIQ